MKNRRIFESLIPRIVRAVLQTAFNVGGKISWRLKSKRNRRTLAFLILLAAITVNFQNCSGRKFSAISYENASDFAADDLPPATSPPSSSNNSLPAKDVVFKSFDSHLCMKDGGLNRAVVQDTCSSSSTVFTEKAQSDGLYVYQKKGSSECLSVLTNSAQERAEVGLQACDNTPQQRFSKFIDQSSAGDIYQIQAQSSAMCINTAESAKTVGTKIIQWFCGQPTDVARPRYANQFFTLETPPIKSEDPPISTTDKCRRFQPGNYIFLEDDPFRPGGPVNGIYGIKNLLAKDLTNFRGLVFKVMWGSLEKSKGDYDFSLIDTALSLAKEHNKYLLLNIAERSFLYGCNRNAFPSYVPQEEGSQDIGIKCAVKVWEPEGMTAFINLHKAIIARYKNDLHFLGFRAEEASMHVPSLISSGDAFRIKMKPQLIRFYQEIHAAEPTMLVGNATTWVDKKDRDDLADALESLGSGGLLNWPDSLPSLDVIGNYQAEHGPAVYRANFNADGSLNKDGWYYLAHNSYKNSRPLVIAPDVQPPMINGSLDAHDKIYRFLRDDIGAHMIIWSDWHSGGIRDYPGEILIPTVNKYQGKLTNTTCPYR
jgi:hypothetical protein